MPKTTDPLFHDIRTQQAALRNRGPRHVPSPVEMSAMRRELEESASYIQKRIEDYVLIPSLALSLQRCVRALMEARDYTSVQDGSRE